ncbi:MAG: hypothetical protein COA78_18220 [Blastopirellula sp.]|nr:MAG: hypothetical protein COA78_18220 [Blastopirellula sp.]
MSDKVILQLKKLETLYSKYSPSNQIRITEIIDDIKSNEINSQEYFEILWKLDDSLAGMSSLTDIAITPIEGSSLSYADIVDKMDEIVAELSELIDRIQSERNRKYE